MSDLVECPKCEGKGWVGTVLDGVVEFDCSLCGGTREGDGKVTRQKAAASMLTEPEAPKWVTFTMPNHVGDTQEVQPVIDAFYRGKKP